MTLVHSVGMFFSRIVGYSGAVLVIILGCFTLKAEAQVFRVEPTILVSEEYNDNVFLQQNDKKATFITRVSPAIHLVYGTSFWDWDVAYTYDYYYFARRDLPDDYTHTLHLRNLDRIIDNFFYIEVRDDYSRVSSNRVIDFTQQSPLANQVDQNVFTFNPYVTLRPATNTVLALGYKFVDTHYKDGGGINSIDNIEYAETTTNLSSRLTVTTGVKYTKDKNTVNNYNELDVYAGPQYAYAEHGYIFLKGGKSWVDFATGDRAAEWVWDAGINHRFATVTGTLGANRSLIQSVADTAHLLTREDSYTASIIKNFERSVMTINSAYREYRDLKNEQMLTTSKELNGVFLHRLTPTTNGILGAGVQKVKDKVANTDTDIYLSSLRIDHQLSPRSFLAFEYRFLYNYTDSRDNYINNRYIVEFRHAF
jgi:hypothetical protein